MARSGVMKEVNELNNPSDQNLLQNLPPNFESFHFSSHILFRIPKW